MARKSRTVAIFSIRINIPLGSSVDAAQEYINNRMLSGTMLPSDHPYASIEQSWFSVTLTKKETTYGA